MHSIRFATLLLALGALLVSTGCGSDERGAPSDTSSADAQIDGVRVPAWVVDPSYNGQFGAVGISRPSLGGMNETFKRAKQEGRVELARIISTKVQAAYVKYFQEGGEIFASEEGNPDLQVMATEMAEDTSRQLTNQVLQGSKQKEFWEHPGTKELYVWMIISEDHRDILANQIKQVASQQVARRSNVAAELKTKEALQRLDAAIDAEIERQGQL